MKKVFFFFISNLLEAKHCKRYAIGDLKLCFKRSSQIEKRVIWDVSLVAVFLETCLTWTEKRLAKIALFMENVIRNLHHILNAHSHKTYVHIGFSCNLLDMFEAIYVAQNLVKIKPA